ncbi:hypothetical protein ACJJTC_007758 [Scirpophaga incertulas]
MILRGTLFLLIVSSVWTSENLNVNGLVKNERLDTSVSYSYWPSMLNAASMIRIRKRELGQIGQNEGGGVKVQPPPVAQGAVPSNLSVPVLVPQKTVPELHVLPDNQNLNIPVNKTATEKKVADIAKVSENTTVTNTSTVSTSPTPMVNVTKLNETIVEPTKTVDLSGPGVVKRGVIVFGGFALLAVAYFLFYRRKNLNKEMNSTHNVIDANQFRYGVLQSEDKRDNLELSRVPLTMESDDDDDDDLEIFDIEQKKKSMSYVNLQLNDEEVVNGLNDAAKNERDNLLLDIEDVNSDALINWSNNGSKSIL